MRKENINGKIENKRIMHKIGWKSQTRKNSAYK